MARKDIERRALLADAWAGSVHDVAAVAHVAMDEMVAGRVPEPNLDISIETWDGPLQQEFASSTVDEFVQKATALDPATVDTITIWAWYPRGQTASEDQSVRVTFSRTAQHPVLIDVEAPAEYTQFVVAAAEAMGRAVEVKERWRPNFERWIRVFAVVVAFASSMIAALADRQQTEWKVVAVGLVVAGASVWVLRRLARWLFPPFELLAEGDHARERRLLLRAKHGLIAAWPLWASFLGTLAAILVARQF